jgi:hypothetical protein
MRNVRGKKLYMDQANSCFAFSVIIDVIFPLNRETAKGTCESISTLVSFTWIVPEQSNPFAVKLNLPLSPVQFSCTLEIYCFCSSFRLPSSFLMRVSASSLGSWWGMSMFKLAIIVDLINSYTSKAMPSPRTEIK